MTIDFFVHPEAGNPQRSSRTNAKLYNLYFNNLISRARTSEFTILITEGNDPHFESLIPGGNQFRSAYGGVLPLNELERLESLLSANPNPGSYTIHGSYFGQCTTGFCVQLFALTVLSQHWSTDDKIEDEAKQTKILDINEREGNFAKSGIKYGVVLQPTGNTEVIQPSTSLLVRLFFPAKRNGNINYQLLGSDTLVY